MARRVQTCRRRTKKGGEEWMLSRAGASAAIGRAGINSRADGGGGGMNSRREQGSGFRVQGSGFREQ
eukprot:754323-Hanusia_phi.AAC.1